MSEEVRGGWVRGREAGATMCDWVDWTEKNDGETKFSDWRSGSHHLIMYDKLIMI